jgi:hypothetical protein
LNARSMARAISHFRQSCLSRTKDRQKASIDPASCHRHGPKKATERRHDARLKND